MIAFPRKEQRVVYEGIAEIGERLMNARRLRMWTQARLAEEAGVSPTTVSGIETGRIARPHFGTIGKLAAALGVAAEELSSGWRPSEREGPSSLSLGWARSTGEEEFEQELEDASLESLNSLSRELEEEQGRLQRLYGEFPEGSEQRRFIKRQIREVAGQFGSVKASAMAMRNRGANERRDEHKETQPEAKGGNPG
jgi:transcriptional regulator with XRE-family HTH domain